MIIFRSLPTRGQAIRYIFLGPEKGPKKDTAPILKPKKMPKNLILSIFFTFEPTIKFIAIVY
jgi:hypothetical protein